MKTITRLLFVFAVTVCVNASAQNSINDLFNTYVIIPAQQRIQILTNELNQVNDQVQSLQNELANSNSASTAAADAGGDADAVNPPSPLVGQIAELQAKTTELQNGLTWWQTQLALWLTFNTQQQEAYLQSHTEIITAQSSPMPDPNNPWVVPVFVSTGDAEHDAQIIKEWLVQHGLMKSE